MSNSPKFSGEQMRLLRLLKGLSQHELGEAIGTSRQYIYQLESNLTQPSLNNISALCIALEVTPKAMEPNSRQSLPPELCHFRKRKTTTLTTAQRVAAFGTLLEDVILYAEKYVDLPEPFSGCDFVNQDETLNRNTIELVAERFRESLTLDRDAPIHSVVDVLENSGVIVTTFSGVSEKVDALSFSKKHHFILRNTAKQSACRQRFDLSHELGHLLMHQGLETGSPATEAEADHFASAFLFPRTAFIKEFPACIRRSGLLNWKEMGKLKLRWKFSLRAIVYRAHSLGLIDSKQYRGANIRLSKIGKSEELDDAIPLEEPSLLQHVFTLLEQEFGISFSEFSKQLGINPEYLAKLLNIEGANLGTHNNILALPPIRAID